MSFSPPPLADNQTALQKMEALAEALHHEMSAVGLSALAPIVEDRGTTPSICLPPLGGADATHLTRLLRYAQDDAHEAAASLHAALLARSLSFPVPRARNGMVALGRVDVDAADHLAMLLGAPPLPDGVLAMDILESSQAAPLIRRIASALASVTNDRDGVIVGFEPSCPQPCCGDAAVRFPLLSVDTARSITDALNPSTEVHE
ncbi:hypothetical protein [Streptomyces sp. NPDC051561]|uniref:hypothetical protein n=1 Tax=Streptomyces sp. NPDC051561 TaxID=3365658 RepID=UPI00379D4642